MGLKITVEDTENIAEGVWQAKVEADELRMLGNSQSIHGDITIILLSKPPFFRSQNQMEFEPSTASILNIGGTSRTIIISSTSGNQKLEATNGKRAIPVDLQSQIINAGDAQFCRELPLQLKDLGKALLSEVRKDFHTGLKYYEKSKTYVQKPDNFWAIKIQPRDGSLRISVRGNPDRFPNVPVSFGLSSGMNSYSTFKITNREQVDEAVRVIKQAAKN